MATMRSGMTCPRCDYDAAERLTDTGTMLELTKGEVRSRQYKSPQGRIECPRCGYFAEYVRNDKTGHWVKKRTAAGAGVLLYRAAGSIAFFRTILATPEAVAKAEVELRDGLATGTVEQACLTRWNEQTRTVEDVVGEFAKIAEFSG